MSMSICNQILRSLVQDEFVTVYLLFSELSQNQQLKICPRASLRVIHDLISEQCSECSCLGWHTEKLHIGRKLSWTNLLGNI